jgi:hypothetical protein
VTSPSPDPVTAPATHLDSASSWARTGIITAIGKGFVPADIQDSYTNVIIRAEFCRMALKWLEYKTGKKVDELLTDGRTLNTGTFSDTTDPDILSAYKLGITAGTKAPTAAAPGAFEPNGQFSREQAATMIRNVCKAAGLDTGNVTPAGFTDISTASSWAVDSINFVCNNWIMYGTSETVLVFSPRETYTREQSIITFNNIK